MGFWRGGTRAGTRSTRDGGLKRLHLPPSASISASSTLSCQRILAYIFSAHLELYLVSAHLGLYLVVQIAKLVDVGRSLLCLVLRH